jgi:CRP-like cAMP-binding protein
MEPLALLQTSKFFRGISPRSLRALAAACIPKRVSRRQVLFMEGQEGDSLYILAEGAIQLFKTSSDGREVVIGTLKQGDIFGEVVLFEQNRYPVGAMALEAGLVLRLTRLQVECLLVDEAFRRDFIAMLMRKQRYLAERILYLSTRDVEERFFDFLEEQYGRRERYRIALSKKDVAAAIGTVPETFSRMLLRLKRQGLAGWQGQTLELRAGFWQEKASGGKNPGKREAP